MTDKQSDSKGDRLHQLAAYLEEIYRGNHNRAVYDECAEILETTTG